MGTRANVYVKADGQKVLYFRPCDGYPRCAGVELGIIARESKYDFDIIIEKLNASADTYMVVDFESSDAEYLYTIDCDTQSINCYDAWDKRYVGEEEYEFYSHSGTEIDSVDLNDFDFSDLNVNIDDELESYFKECEKCEDNQEWSPRFPVNVDNPSVLTEDQEKKGEKIFETLCKFMDAHPNDDFAPTLCITQEWNISADYGGWRSMSDYVDSSTCVMCRDDDGFYLNLDYVKQCVPFLEKELEKSAEWCMEEYGEVPSHKDQTLHRIVTLETKILDTIWDIIDSGLIEDTMLEIDTLEQTVYSIPSDIPREEYGGIIRFVPVKNYIVIGNDGTVDVNLEEVKKLSSEIDNAY